MQPTSPSEVNISVFWRKSLQSWRTDERNACQLTKIIITTPPLGLWMGLESFPATFQVFVFFFFFTLFCDCLMLLCTLYVKMSDIGTTILERSSEATWMWYWALCSEWVGPGKPRGSLLSQPCFHSVKFGWLTCYTFIWNEQNKEFSPWSKGYFTISRKVVYKYLW